MKSHPDQKYIQALIENNTVLIEAIYQRFSKQIIRYIQQNSGTLQDAEEIFGDALMAIRERAIRAPFVLTCPFGAYLYRICHNKWISEIKKDKLRQVTIQPLEEYDSVAGAEDQARETLLKEDRWTLFDKKFDLLGESCQNILRLSWGGYSMKDVAERLDISYQYARKKKSECISRLMKLVQGDPTFTHLKE